MHILSHLYPAPGAFERRLLRRRRTHRSTLPPPGPRSSRSRPRRALILRAHELDSMRHSPQWRVQALPAGEGDCCWIAAGLLLDCCLIAASWRRWHATGWNPGMDHTQFSAPKAASHVFLVHCPPAELRLHLCDPPTHPHEFTPLAVRGAFLGAIARRRTRPEVAKCVGSAMGRMQILPAALSVCSCVDLCGEGRLRESHGD